MHRRTTSTRLGLILLPALIGGLALAPPAPAFEPLTMIAREIVRTTLKQFVHDRVMDGLKAQMGQCAFMLAQVGAGSGALRYQAAQASLSRIDRVIDLGANAAVPSLGGPSIPDADMAAMTAGVAGMKRVAGAGAALPGDGIPAGLPQVPGMPAGMPGATGMPDLSNLPAAMGGAGGMGNLPSMPSMPAGMAMPDLSAMGLPGAMAGSLPAQMPGGMGGTLQGAATQRVRDMAAMSGGGGDLAALGAPGGAMAGSPDQMAMVQQMMMRMQQSPPMTAAETAEMGDRMVTMAEMFGELIPAEQRCSPEDTRTSIRIAASMPMASGAMKMMLDSFRQMDGSMAQSRATFAQMSPEARQEFVDSALADYRAMGPDERQAYALMVKGNYFGMPDDLRTQVRAAIEAGG